MQQSICFFYAVVSYFDGFLFRDMLLVASCGFYAYSFGWSGSELFMYVSCG